MAKGNHLTQPHRKFIEIKNVSSCTRYLTKVGIIKLVYLLLDVGNTGELVAALSQHRPATLGLLEVVRARLSIDPLEGHASEAAQVRPVGGEVQALERLLLGLQLLL